MPPANSYRTPTIERGPSVERLLLVRLSAVGDNVHTLPVAAALAAGGYDVLWAVQPGGQALVAGNPAVAACAVIPARSPFRPAAIRRAVIALRAAKIDTALDFQGLWKSAFWARASRA